MDHREAAQRHLRTLVDLMKAQPPGAPRDALIEECEALITAVRAFHMEAIRFRMYNVDRRLTSLDAPAEARTAFTDARHELEEAGFHTRSHQAPS